MATLKRSTQISNVFTPYYCSECRMRQQELRPFCSYCGETFSNYEDVLVEMYEDKREDEIKK